MNSSSLNTENINERIGIESRTFQDHLSLNTIEKNDLYDEFNYLTQPFKQMCDDLDVKYYTKGIFPFTCVFLELILLFSLMYLDISMLFILGIIVCLQCIGSVYNMLIISYLLPSKVSRTLTVDIGFKNINDRFNKYLRLRVMDGIHAILILGLGIMNIVPYPMLLLYLSLYLTNRKVTFNLSYFFDFLYLHESMVSKNYILISKGFCTGQTYHDLEEYLKGTMSLLPIEDNGNDILVKVRNLTRSIRRRLSGRGYFKGSWIEEMISLNNELLLDLKIQLVSSGNPDLLDVLRNEGREIRIDREDRKVITDYCGNLDPNDKEDEDRIRGFILDLHGNGRTFNRIGNLGFMRTLVGQLRYPNLPSKQDKYGKFISILGINLTYTRLSIILFLLINLLLVI